MFLFIGDFMKKLNLSLRFIIIILTFTVLLLTLLNAILAGYRVSKETLIENTLETNRVYSVKLAETVELTIDQTLLTMQYSSNKLQNCMTEECMLEEVTRLQKQMDIFNSVFITNEKGTITSVYPSTLPIIGGTLTSEAAKEALAQKKDYVSKPYISPLTHNMIVMISVPIYNPNHEYVGMLGGTVYLEKDNMFESMLGKHPYKDGSSVCVVDRDGNLIYNEDKDKVGNLVKNPIIIEELLTKKDGTIRVTNTDNTNMLVGYAYVPKAEWGIISQRPTNQALESISIIMKDMFVRMFFFIIILLVVIFWLTNKITRPLSELSDYANKSQGLPTKDLSFPKIDAWYYEAKELKNALFDNAQALSEQLYIENKNVILDSATGLLNENACKSIGKYYETIRQPFAIIIISMNNFSELKQTFGPHVCTETLKFIATLLQQEVKKDGIVFRCRDEQFAILLKTEAKHDAKTLSEIIHKKMNETITPCGKYVATSFGIAYFIKDGLHFEDVVIVAQKRLQKAKQNY